MVEAIQQLQDAEVEPDVWKIEGLDNHEDCKRIVASARRQGRNQVGCIILGRGEDDKKVHEWLSVAAAVPGFIGFAVGRTSFWEPLVDWRAKKITRNDAVAEIAGRYQEFAEIFETPRPGCPCVTWAQAEGTPLPLGVTWIEQEQAFNFALHAENAESVTLLLFSSTDLVNPLLTFRFDFLRNKSGRIWHCRVPITEIGEARYYGYSVSGQTAPQLHSFDPQKVLLDPYAKCIFFPPGFDRELATREGANAGHAPLGRIDGSPVDI